MNVFQAFRYFLREAAVGLVRSFRVSLLAIFTIAVSLFLSGLLFLVSKNLSRTVRDWRAEARFTVYLAPEVDAATKETVRSALAAGRWTTRVDEVAPAQARERFERAFPSLSELVAERGEGALPLSFEAALRPIASTESDAFAEWVRDLRGLAGVSMVDADQDWIEQVETFLTLIRGLGLALAAILIGASVFTIASVVRLTSFLYREEIAVMRLVGATEFYIRGPFYFEGILQGLLGGLIAASALFGIHLAIQARIAQSQVAQAVAASFLAPGELAVLIGFGALAGWAGAIVSLSRESLDPAND